MRLLFSSLVCLMLALGCKSTRESPRSEPSQTEESSANLIQSESDLPPCDDIARGRVYWVRSIQKHFECAEGGKWSVRDIEAENSKDPSFGNRSIDTKK